MSLKSVERLDMLSFLPGLRILTKHMRPRFCAAPYSRTNTLRYFKKALSPFKSLSIPGRCLLGNTAIPKKTSYYVDRSFEYCAGEVCKPSFPPLSSIHPISFNLVNLRAHSFNVTPFPPSSFVASLSVGPWIVVFWHYILDPNEVPVPEFGRLIGI